MMFKFGVHLRGKIYKKFNNDSVDRYHQIYFPQILLGFAALCCIRYFALPAIRCFENAYEVSDWTDFIESYCYVDDKKYFVRPDQVVFPLPLDETRRTVTMEYYPWVSAALIFQAFLCVIPQWIWDTFSYHTGIVIRPLAAALEKDDNRVRKIMKVKGFVKSNKADAAKEFLQVLNFNSKEKKKIFGFIPNTEFVSTFYAFYKCLNLVNMGGQILFLSWFLNIRLLSFWGAEIFWDILHGLRWKISGRFPRVIYCDFPRRDDSTGKPIGGTSQCLIALNMFNEIMYIAIWFLLYGLIILNVISIVKLCIFLNRKESRVGFIEDLLKPHGIDRKHPNFDQFVHDVLGKDGLVTLRLLSANSASYFVSKFIKELFNQSFPSGSEQAMEV